MIYLRTSDENLYESVRQHLDAAWGHPTADGRTVTCFSPSSIAVRDSQNRIMLAIQEEFIAYEPAATMLPSLIAASVVEEISEADYMTAVPQDLP
jgi:hypothetical protein